MDFANKLFGQDYEYFIQYGTLVMNFMYTSGVLMEIIVCIGKIPWQLNASELAYIESWTEWS